MLLKRMTSAIAHRGPDDAHEWFDHDAGVGLGFRRLSIIDLSSAGQQPMASSSGRYVTLFNGEIYNFSTLRDTLAAKGARFRGHSDTEVLLAAVEQWGLAEAIKQCAGMFALALWDRADQTLHLARDRFGEKPLYFARNGDTLVFGSELKALRAHPSWTDEIDRGAVALYLRHNYVPAPYSIYKNARKVVPGTIVSFRQRGFDSPSITSFWSALEVAERGVRDPIIASDTEMLERLDALLRRTISQEMVADVPLGAFLSGGVDSSLLVALMQSQSQRPIQTFTIGFEEAGYNEAVHAKAVAQHLGTDHTELYVTPRETMDVIPRLPAIYDEPFADSSQIPTFLVAQLARRSVTVSLSGEGGDELFGGYNRYFWGRRVWNQMQMLPKSARSGIARCIESVAPARWDSMFDGMASILPRRYRAVTPGHKLHKVASFLAVSSPDEMYRTVMTHWPDPAAMAGVAEPPTVLTTATSLPTFSSPVERMMYFDMVSELPDDILVKVDRATMAVSLESRAPFLHHEVAEFAWRIPLHQKLRGGRGKWLLRELLYKHVPAQLIDRPKMGFGVPIDAWLRGPLRDWASELLAPARLTREGFFDPRIVAAAWEEHLRGARPNAQQLWGVLMFQAWLEQTHSA